MTALIEHPSARPLEQMSRALFAQDQRQALLERRAEVLADRPLLEALDERSQESLDHESLGHLFRQSSRAQVEELFGVDLGDRGGVGAANVVGLNLEPGDRIRVGAL